MEAIGSVPRKSSPFVPKRLAAILGRMAAFRPALSPAVPQPLQLSACLQPLMCSAARAKDCTAPRFSPGLVARSFQGDVESN